MPTRPSTEQWKTLFAIWLLRAERQLPTAGDDVVVAIGADAAVEDLELVGVGPGHAAHHELELTRRAGGHLADVEGTGGDDGAGRVLHDDRRPAENAVVLAEALARPANRRSRPPAVDGILQPEDAGERGEGIS